MAKWILLGFRIRHNGNVCFSVGSWNSLACGEAMTIHIISRQCTPDGKTCVTAEMLHDNWTIAKGLADRMHPVHGFDVETVVFDMVSIRRVKRVRNGEVISP